MRQQTPAQHWPAGERVVEQQMREPGEPIGNNLIDTFFQTLSLIVFGSK